jgi:hypothetical protein
MDELERRLRRLAADAPPPPGELIERTREAAPPPEPRRGSSWSRRAIALVAGAGLIAFAFTPPGRAATDWIAGLAGVGEEPTLPQEGSVEGSATVLASGTLEDGTPYEIVVKGFTADSFIEEAADSPTEAAELRERAFGHGIEPSICVQVDWPSLRDVGAGGACTERVTTGTPRRAGFGTHGLYKPPGDAHGSGGILLGIVEGPAAEAEVVQTDRSGEERQLESQFIHIEGAQLEQAGGRYPVAVLVAELGRDVIKAGETRQAQVTAVVADAAGTEAESRDVFPPLDCPLNPEELLPEPQAVPPPPRPTAPNDDALRAMECGLEPQPPSKLYMKQANLSRAPLAEAARADASTFGYELVPATDAELASVFAEDFKGTTALDLMSESPYPAPEGAVSIRGPVHVYLARDTGSDRLVYVVQRQVRAVGRSDGGFDRTVAGLPRQYLTIVNATSGEVLLEEELP